MRSEPWTSKNWQVGLLYACVGRLLRTCRSIRGMANERTKDYLANADSNGPAVLNATKSTPVGLGRREGVCTRYAVDRNVVLAHAWDLVGLLDPHFRRVHVRSPHKNAHHRPSTTYLAITGAHCHQH